MQWPGAVGFRICLALKKKHGYSVSAQSYDICHCLKKLDIFDFTLSRIDFLINRPGVDGAVLQTPLS